MDKLTALCKAMITYDKGDPRRIHHFLKVHAFAAQIGREEGLDEKTLFLLEAAAYVHDIGIHEGERRFGRNDGQIQQELGPDEARPMLERVEVAVREKKPEELPLIEDLKMRFEAAVNRIAGQNLRAADVAEFQNAVNKGL